MGTSVLSSQYICDHNSAWKAAVLQHKCVIGLSILKIWRGCCQSNVDCVCLREVRIVNFQCEWNRIASTIQKIFEILNVICIPLAIILSSANERDAREKASWVCGYLMWDLQITCTYWAWRQSGWVMPTRSWRNQDTGHSNIWYRDYGSLKIFVMSAMQVPKTHTFMIETESHRACLHFHVFMVAFSVAFTA